MLHTSSQLKYSYECLYQYVKDLLLSRNIIREELSFETDSTASVNQSFSNELSKKAPEINNINDLCDPMKFSLDINSDESTKRKQKITKEDFFTQKANSEPNPSDPFSFLDPLKK
jgi:hypothetical protein